MAQAVLDRDWTVHTREPSRDDAASSSLSEWTRRIVTDEASLTDVPARKRPRIAREIKAYANHFPDVGESATVRRLIDDLTQAEVGVDE